MDSPKKLLALASGDGGDGSITYVNLDHVCWAKASREGVVLVTADGARFHNNPGPEADRLKRLLQENARLASGEDFSEVVKRVFPKTEGQS